MNLTNTSDIKFKSGLTIYAGTPCEIKFQTNSNVCELHCLGVLPGWTKFRLTSLPRYFNKFKEPSLKTMEKWSNDGVAKSMLGKRVEPDGHDDEGSPSWMLVLGLM